MKFDKIFYLVLVHCWAFLIAILILSVELAIIVYLLTNNRGRYFFLDFFLIKITLWFWALTEFIDNGSRKHFIFISLFFIRFSFLQYCKLNLGKVILKLQRNYRWINMANQNDLFYVIVFFDARRERKNWMIYYEKNCSEKNIFLCKNLSSKSVH